jgi:hypothetical protein
MKNSVLRITVFVLIVAFTLATPLFSASLTQPTPTPALEGSSFAGGEWEMVTRDFAKWKCDVVMNGETVRAFAKFRYPPVEDVPEVAFNIDRSIDSAGGDYIIYANGTFSMYVQGNEHELSANERAQLATIAKELLPKYPALKAYWEDKTR